MAAKTRYASSTWGLTAKGQYYMLAGYSAKSENIYYPPEACGFDSAG